MNRNGFFSRLFYKESKYYPVPCYLYHCEKERRKQEGEAEKRYSLTLKVLNREGKGIEKAQFAIQFKEKLLQTADSNSQGVICFSNLLPGDYVLLQTSVGKEYQVDRKTHIITISSQGLMTIDGKQKKDMVIINEKNVVLRFVKQDKKGRPICGCEYVLLHKNGTKYKSSSDKNGIISFYAIEPGIYQLKQTIPAIGYRLNESIYDVVVSKDGRITVNGRTPENFVVIEQEIN